MAEEAIVDEVVAPAKKTPREWQKYWQREKIASDERVEKFIKSGNKIVQRYIDEGSRVDDKGTAGSRLNLFHKNIKTTLDMLYGKRPKIDVSREHKDPDDDPARVASYLLKRILEAGCADPTLLRAALQDRLLPGLGVARVRYDVETSRVTGIDGEEREVVADESAITEYVHWQDFRWGWGRTWDEIPWIGFRVFLPKEDAIERFGEKVANNLTYKAKTPGGTAKNESLDSEEQNSHTHEAEIWEFWHKREKQVFWWSDGAELLLDIKDDPLQLERFWPVPRPMAANLTTSMYLPTADFKLAQDLYNEIDVLQTRISILTEAIKVVGVYDQSAGGSVGRMLLEGKENELIPVENWAMFTEGGGLQRKIEWFPVQEIVATLDTLAKVQQNKISQLYEITGMSTLMRGGDTDQYTSDGTNKLSAKFGSISIQALQDEFAQFASDLQALKAEVISKHYLPRSIYIQSNAEFIPQADKHLLDPAMQLLKSPTTKWRIEISPESVAMVDYAQLQNERVSYITALSTYLQSSQAMLKQVPGSMPLLLEFMKFGLAGFKGADYMEGILDQAIEAALKSPPQGQDDGKAQEGQLKLQLEQMKLQGQQQKLQGEIQKIQVKSQADMQNIQAKLQGEIQKITVDAQRDQALEDQQSQYALLEIAKELEAALVEIQANTDSALMIEQEQARLDMGLNRQEHQHTLTEISAQPRNDTNG